MARTLIAPAVLAAAALAACADSEAPPEDVAEADAPAPTPEPDRDPATRAPTAELPDDYLRTPWAEKGGDCGKPNFDITENMAGGLTVETSLRGAPRDGYVRQGDAPALIFGDTVLPIQRRGVDGLAVMPPEDGPVDFAGLRLTGDGTVFIQCSRR